MTQYIELATNSQSKTYLQNSKHVYVPINETVSRKELLPYDTADNWWFVLSIIFRVPSSKGRVYIYILG